MPLRMEPEIDFRAIIDRMEQGFCIIEVLFAPSDAGEHAIDYRFIEVNAAFERECGLIQAKGRRMRDMVPDHDQHWFDIYGEVALTGRAVTFENCAAALNRWFSVNAFRIGPAEERRVAVFFTDISERVKARALTRQAEARLRETIAVAPAFMAVIRGPDLVFELANDAYMKLVRGRDVVGRRVEEALPEVVDQGFSALLRKAMETGEPYHGRGVRVLLATADGRELEPRYLDFVYQPLREPDGTISGVLVHGVDLTERVLTEQLLAQSCDALDRTAQSLSLAQRAANAGVWDWDFQRNVYVSQEYRDLFGYSPDEQVSYERFLQAVHPEDRQAIAAYGQDFFASGTDYRVEFRIIHPSRGVRWLAGVGTLMRDEQGAPRRFSGINIDITERKKGEEERGLLLEKLERINAELQRFVSIASHDLKEPLRGIATLASFVAEDEASLSADGHHRLTRIRELCSRLTSMVTGLLEYARLGGEPRRMPCRLSEIVERSIDKLAEGLSGRVEITLDLGLPLIQGDPLLLERIFGNLISNAVKYNSSDPKRIEIGSAGDSVYIRDNGMGIDPRHHESIFSLFRRGPGAPERDGIGLGLALVRNIVELHGGSIRLQSAPGEGSTFFIQFPDAAPSGEHGERRYSLAS